jgi:RluA family pseudouridine synthase
MPIAPPVERTYRLSCDVDPYRDGWTLERFLTHRFRYHPVPIWKERLAAGAVCVNGSAAEGALVVRRGDRVEYTLVHTEPAVDFAYEVLFDDAHLLAVAKSGNLPVHAGGKFIQNTLISRIKEDRGEKYRLAHRLDRETSGVVVMAKTREAAAACEREFRERRVGKRYLAVVRGSPPETLRVDAPIARREPAEAPHFRVVDPGSGKPAVTTFRRLEVGRAAAPPHDTVTLVEALPESGRPNQIRVHAAHAGFPVLGDKVYGVPEELARAFVRGGPTEEIDAAAGAPRHLLHCAEIVIRHPATEEPLRLKAKVPADFAAAWEVTPRSR